MTYEQRINLIKEWFKADIISRFNMPRDLDHTLVAMDVIEAVNSNIPNQATPERVRSLVALIAKEVTQTARTRTLPSVKEFVDAARNVAQSGGAARSAPTTTSLDRYHLNAQRILSGMPVCDSYLHGDARKKLIEEYNITEENLAPYDSYVARAAHKQ